MDLSSLPSLDSLSLSTDDSLSLILTVGIGGVVFLLALLKISFMSIKKIDSEKLKAFDDEISE